MGYGWSCRGRLSAIGLVWDVGSDDPRYEIAKMERRSLRRRTRLQAPGREMRIERDRWRRRFIAGRPGEYFLRRSGKYRQYEALIEGRRDTVQVGDMGIGFRAFSPRLRTLIIRGNHDNPDVCRREVQWIADGTVEEDVMFVGGAPSIDRGMRTEDLDWWAGRGTQGRRARPPDRRLCRGKAPDHGHPRLSAVPWRPRCSRPSGHGVS